MAAGYDLEKYGDTPHNGMHASPYGDTELERKESELLKLCKNDCRDKVRDFERLLNDGANPNIYDKRHNTPLMLASCHGNKEFVKLLVNFKAYIDLTDRDGKTALHIACEEGHVDVVSELKEIAKVHLKDKLGKTPLDYAREKGHRDIVLLFETGDLPSDSDTKAIAILFTSEKIPFEALVSKVVADESLGWDIDKERERGRNAKFRVKNAFDVAMSCYKWPRAYLEIQVSKVGDSALFLQDACVHVRETVQQKLKLAANDANSVYSLAFFCTCSQTSSRHMMTVEMPTPLPPKHAVCNYKPLNQDLSDGTHLDWFAPCLEDFDSVKKGHLRLNFTQVPNLQLQRKGKNVPLISANIEEVVIVNKSQVDAIIKNRTIEGQPKETVLEMSTEIKNDLREPVDQAWNFKYSNLHSKEKSHMKSTSWNVGGELKPTVSAGEVEVGIGGLSASYGRHSEKKDVTLEQTGSEKTEAVNFSVPGKKTVIVKLLEISQKFKGTVENVSISFNPKAKVNCKVLKESSGNEKAMRYELRDLIYLNDQPIVDKDEVQQWSVSACYEWTEIKTQVCVEPVSD